MSVEGNLATITGILATVARTGAATVLPALTLSMTGTEELVGVSLTDPEPTRKVSLLFPANRYRTDAAQASADHVRAVTSALPGPSK